MREVLTLEPFSQKPSSNEIGQVWHQLAENLNGSAQDFRVTKRSCRDRFKKLISDFQKKDKKSKKSSGIEESYSEMDQLCQDIQDRIEEVEKLRNDDKEKEKKKEEQAALMRQKAMESLGKRKRKGKNEDEEEEEEEEQVSEKRTRRKSADSLQYLRDSLEQRTTDAAEERKLKEKELDIRQEELTQQREQQKGTSSMIMQMMQSQQQLMAGLLKQMGEKKSN